MLSVSQNYQICLQKLDISIPFIPEVALDYLWTQISGIEISQMEDLYLERQVADFWKLKHIWPREMLWNSCLPVLKGTFC